MTICVRVCVPDNLFRARLNEATEQTPSKPLLRNNIGFDYLFTIIRPIIFSVFIETLWCIVKTKEKNTCVKTIKKNKINKNTYRLYHTRVLLLNGDLKQCFLHNSELKK